MKKAAITKFCKVPHCCGRGVRTPVVLTFFCVIFLLAVALGATYTGLDAANYQKAYGKTLSGLLALLNGPDAFHGTWFIVAAGVLCLLVVATLFGREGRERLACLRTPTTQPDAATLKSRPVDEKISAAEAEKLRKQLRKKRFYEIFHGGSGESTVTCHTRGRWRFAGWFAMLVGIFCLGLAGVLNGWLGYSGTVKIEEGAQEQVVKSFNGRRAVPHSLPFVLRHNRFNSDVGFHEAPARPTVNFSLMEGERGKEEVTLTGNLVGKDAFHRRGSHLVGLAGWEQDKPMVAVTLKNMAQPTGLLARAVTAVGNSLENEAQENAIFLDAFHGEGPLPGAVESHTIPGFKQEGPALDYVLRNIEGGALGLRTYLKYPKVMGVNDGEGIFTPVYMGLPINTLVGWKAYEVYAEALAEAKNPTEEEKVALFAKVAAKHLSTEGEAAVAQAADVMQAADVFTAFKTPYMFQLEEYRLRFMPQFRVDYRPAHGLEMLGAILFALGGLLWLLCPFARFWIIGSKKGCRVVADGTCPRSLRRLLKKSGKEGGDEK